MLSVPINYFLNYSNRIYYSKVMISKMKFKKLTKENINIKCGYWFQSVEISIKCFVKLVILGLSLMCGSMCLCVYLSEGHFIIIAPKRMIQINCFVKNGLHRVLGKFAKRMLKLTIFKFFVSCCNIWVNLIIISTKHNLHYAIIKK